MSDGEESPFIVGCHLHLNIPVGSFVVGVEALRINPRLAVGVHLSCKDEFVVDAYQCRT